MRAAQGWPMLGITRFVGVDGRRGLVICSLEYALVFAWEEKESIHRTICHI